MLDGWVGEQVLLQKLQLFYGEEVRFEFDIVLLLKICSFIKLPWVLLSENDEESCVVSLLDEFIHFLAQLNEARCLAPNFLIVCFDFRSIISLPRISCQAQKIFNVGSEYISTSRIQLIMQM